MTHELKEIVSSYKIASSNKEKCVLATLTDLKGSAYRRPGVRMLVTDTGNLTGAISGGCIEKDVLTEAVSVFKTGESKMMTYDGRYRLGCEGKIYILLEIFDPSEAMLEAFEEVLEERIPLEATSYYTTDINNAESGGMGSFITLGEKTFPLNQGRTMESLGGNRQMIFNEALPPMFRLVIFGGEYDAAKLTRQASLLGWQVILVTSPFDGYTIANFPGAHEVLQVTAENLPGGLIDDETAVVLMSHNYAKDLGYLAAIKDLQPFYLGMLGPAKRRNNLMNDLLERDIDIPEALSEVMHGPAGLDIGSETAEEIALSICSEIISLQRDRSGGNLKDIKGEIHQKMC